MGKIGIVVLVGFVFFGAGCNVKERYVRTVELPLVIVDNQELVVSLNVGSIRICGKDIGNGSIVAKITGKGETVEKAKAVAESISIKVEVGVGKKSVFIKIDKPVKIKSSWYAVNYVIESPENISVRAKTDVGRISISNIRGEIFAASDVGTINCKNVFGKTHLKTDVGNVSLAYNEDAPNQVDSVVSVDVGNITFKGPGGLSAKVDAGTDVGSIKTSLPITVEGNLCSKKISGVVGNGEGEIRLKTDVGSIKIVK